MRFSVPFQELAALAVMLVPSLIAAHWVEQIRHPGDPSTRDGARTAFITNMLYGNHNTTPDIM
jgi:hypothetical protein